MVETRDKLAIGLGIFFALVFIIPIIALVFYMFLPLEHWVLYSNVVPTIESVPVGEYPQFKSIRDVRKEVWLEWVDIMFCENEQGEYARFVSFESNGTAKQTEGVETSDAWVYGREQNLPMPNVATKCYLDVTVIKPSPFDFLRTYFDKRQHLVSERFSFVE
jgi:hypothetical protein